MSGTVAAERESGGPRHTSIKHKTVCRTGTMAQKKNGEGGGRRGGEGSWGRSQASGRHTDKRVALLGAVGSKCIGKYLE